jgi:hypothetical protein
MKLSICSFVLSVAIPAIAIVSAQTTTIDFNNDTVGESPGGFSTALTGQRQTRQVGSDERPASPNQGNVLAQTDADTTGYRFSGVRLLWSDAKDVDITMKFKPVSGKR